jgi:hypothetical protein
MHMKDLWRWIEREESHEDLVTPVPIVALAATLDRDERGRTTDPGGACA